MRFINHSLFTNNQGSQVDRPIADKRYFLFFASLQKTFGVVEREREKKKKCK